MEPGPAWPTIQYEATRLREQPVAWSMLLVIAANVIVFWSLAAAATDGRLDLGAMVIYAQSAVGVSMIAFGGFSWALDGASTEHLVQEFQRHSGDDARRRLSGYLLAYATFRTGFCRMALFLILLKWQRGVGRLF